jgi:signal transduction histidine kinase
MTARYANETSFVRGLALSIVSMANDSRKRRRGRFVRHYFLISGLVVGAGLIVSGALEAYFTYRDNQEHLTVLQREVTEGVAFKIERFLQELERLMLAATKSREIALSGITPQYKFELERLLLVAPAITSVMAIGPDGASRVQASRVSIASSMTTKVSPEAVRTTLQGHSYFGPVYFVRGSEPYMTLAVPIESFPGEIVGVLQAEANLKYIWDELARVRLGKSGYAYAVTRAGDLVAHSDISLVLQRHNLSGLQQVKAAFASDSHRPSGAIGLNLRGKRVFSSNVRVPGVDWAVISEQPIAEAFAPIYASLWRTFALLLIGLAIVLVASIFLARRVVSPLRELRDGARRIGEGDLEHRVVLDTGDELEALADAFNGMASALRESYSGLEEKIEQRTRELSVANQRLDEVSRHKSQFLANMSHELRTPLNAIIGFTRLVLRKTEGQVPALQTDNLRKVLVSGESLLKLINGLLDLSKIEAGRMDVYPEMFELEQVVEPAVSTIDSLLRHDEVRLVVNLEPNIGPLRTDREKLGQIIINLLGNAAKFTEQGEIRLSARRENTTLRLIISDTGIGMEREVQAYIFEEFRQVKSASIAKYGGTGLGLPIVKKLVTLLRGDIFVESEPGRGSRFTVTLPADFSEGGTQRAA